MCELWIEQQPTTEFDGACVKTTYVSGDEVYYRRVSRAFFRKYLENSLRMLNEFEAAERKAQRVVRMDARRPVHR